MPGRPRLMAKRVDAFCRGAGTLCGDMLKVIPDQYRVQGVILPEWEEEEDELLVMASESEKIGLYWRACIGHAVQLEILLKGLAWLLREKAGLPALADPEQQVPDEGKDEHQNAQAEQAGDVEADNATGDEGPEVAP